MADLRERLAQIIDGSEAVWAEDVTGCTAESGVVLPRDVAAALVAVADAVATPTAFAEAAGEVYRVLRWHSGVLISEAKTPAEEDEIMDALSAFEAAQGPLSKALDALAAALGVSR